MSMLMCDCGQLQARLTKSVPTLVMRRLEILDGTTKAIVVNIIIVNTIIIIIIIVIYYYYYYYYYYNYYYYYFLQFLRVKLGLF